MKRIAILTTLILAAVSAFGQAVRVDIPLQTSGPSVPITVGALPQALWVANSTAYICTHPSATFSACQAAPITTYTDSTEGTTCPTATPLVQLPGNTCTASTGTAANVGFWYGGSLFDYWIVSSYGTYGPFSGGGGGGLTAPVQINQGGTGAITAAGAAANIVNGNLINPSILNSIVFANEYATGGDGTIGNPWTSPSGTGGVQEAIAAVAASGTVFLASGYYSITSTITITTKTVSIIGAGWGSILYVSASFSTSSPVILLQPGSSETMDGFMLKDFKVIPVSGNPGSHAIEFDGTNNQILYGVIDHLYLGYTNGYSIYAHGSGNGQGVPALTVFRDSLFVDGMNLTNTGDSVHVIHNQIADGSDTTSISFIQGAVGFKFDGNNITNAGGIKFTNGEGMDISDNDMQTLAGWTGSNGAFFDFDGNSLMNMRWNVLKNNVITVGTGGVSGAAVRLNYALSFTLKDNVLNAGASGGCDILETANSSENFILQNTFYTPTLSTMVCDSGVDNKWTPSTAIVNTGVPVCDVSHVGAIYMNTGDTPSQQETCVQVSTSPATYNLLPNALMPAWIENWLLESGTPTPTVSPWVGAAQGAATAPTCTAAPSIADPNGAFGDVYECIFTVTGTGDFSELYQLVSGLPNPNKPAASVWVQAKTGTSYLNLGFVGLTVNLIQATSTWQQFSKTLIVAATSERWLLDMPYTPGSPLTSDVYIALPQMSFHGGIYVPTTSSTVSIQPVLSPSVICRGAYVAGDYCDPATQIWTALTASTAYPENGWFGCTNQAQSTTDYASPVGYCSTVATIMNAPIVVSKTASALNCATNNAPASGQNIVFALQTGAKGSLTSTALTCTISNPATTCSDVTHTAAMTAGQYWQGTATSSATAGALYWSCGMQMQ